jgi:hypothetical protein
VSRKEVFAGQATALTFRSGILRGAMSLRNTLRGLVLPRELQRRTHRKFKLIQRVLRGRFVAHAGKTRAFERPVRAKLRSFARKIEFPGRGAQKSARVERIRRENKRSAIRFCTPGRKGGCKTHRHPSAACRLLSTAYRLRLPAAVKFSHPRIEPRIC